MGNAPSGSHLPRVAGATDRGRARAHNEDHVLVRDDLLLYLVADGAGGHNAGDVASALASRSIENYFGASIRESAERPDIDAFGMPWGARRLSAAVQKANHDVVEISKSSDKHRGMGTTVVAASFSPRPGLLHIAHVGDSRCYRLRAGNLELLTKDHSLLNDVLEQRPDIDDAVLARLPKNVITRALGMEEKVRVSVRSHSVVAGDRYLLCSDGVSGVVPAEAIAAALALPDPPSGIVKRLIDLANDAGGPDNIAALVIACDAGLDIAMPASARLSPGPSRPPESSEPEILILGIEDLDTTGAPQFRVVPTGSGGIGLIDAIGKLVDPKR